MGIKVGRWVVDNARPEIAVRHRNGVTVCFYCGNAMVYAGKDRFAKCCECGRIVEIIEDNDWIASKRMMVRHFASLEVVEGIQVIRTYEVVFRYNAINRLKDYSVRELCRHWITSDGRWAVTSLRHYVGGLMPWSRKMKLRKGSTDIEDALRCKPIIFLNNLYNVPTLATFGETVFPGIYHSITAGEANGYTVRMTHGYMRSGIVNYPPTNLNPLRGKRFIESGKNTGHANL